MVSFILIEKLVSYPSKIGALPQNTTVEIPKFSSLSNIALILEENNVIENRYFFIIYSYMTGKAKLLKAGEYYFSKNISQAAVLNKLYKNEVKLYKLVIPECYSNKQVFELIKKNLYFLGVLMDYSEGSFFPSTYYFSKDTKANNLLDIMQKTAKVKFSKIYNDYKNNISDTLDNNEVLILASIVEAEAKIKEDKSKIAAVFLNRLKKGMKLQSDPTVIYGINKTVHLDRAIKKSDLLIEHAWNTYKISGLPPTPICNVGIDSIYAVLNPEKSTNLYFVADGKGGHIFSETYVDHKKHIKNIYKK